MKLMQGKSLDGNGSPAAHAQGAMAAAVGADGGRTIPHAGSRRIRGNHELNEELLEAAAQSATVVVGVTSPDGQVLWINDAVTRITGYTPAEFIGRRMGELLNAEQTDPHALATCRYHRERGLPLSIKLYGRNKSGQGFWAQLHLLPRIDVKGVVCSYSVLMTDVTREVTEPMALGSEERDRVLAAFSHDVRTPLGSIISLLELMGDTGLESSQRQLVEQAMDAARALRLMVQGSPAASSTGAWTQAPRPAVRPAQLTPTDSRELFSGLLVLVVDDNAMSRFVARKQLERVGAEVLEAEHGALALDSLAQRRMRLPDVILLDVNMPVMDGPSLAAKLQADRQYRFIPLIAVSAALDEATIALLRTVGVHQFVEKPFERHELVRALSGVRFGGPWPHATR